MTTSQKRAPARRRKALAKAPMSKHPRVVSDPRMHVRSLADGFSATISIGINVVSMLGERTLDYGHGPLLFCSGIPAADTWLSEIDMVRLIFRDEDVEPVKTMEDIVDMVNAHALGTYLLGLAVAIKYMGGDPQHVLRDACGLPPLHPDAWRSTARQQLREPSAPPVSS